MPTPNFLYGTAWKEDDTQRLTELAIAQGFRGIDTANQRRHYHEAAVGLGIQAAMARGEVARGDLFLQTKFTFRPGQDHRLPYDPAAPIATQVAQSLASSREHLGVEIIDSYVLHGPMQREGLTADDWSAWRAMEAAHDAGEVRQLGVSNVSPGQLELLCAQARIAPRFVQNRCFAVQAWDLPVRRICQAHDITYQGFSLLTANREVVSHADVAQIAKHYRRTPAQIVFRFALQLGMLPLTGTTDPAHMQADLAVVDFELTETEVKHIERLGVR